MWLGILENFGWLRVTPAGSGPRLSFYFNALSAGTACPRPGSHPMTGDSDDIRVRPGRGKDGGSGAARKAQSLAAQVRRAAARSGHLRRAPGPGRGGGTGRHGRGRSAALRARFQADGRRVVIKARVVRHRGARFRAAPLARHVGYLKRDGVTRDNRDASLFDARGDGADGEAFAERCEDDRHHFRFIVSPEDASDMADLRAFITELLADVARDLGTDLDWVAVDHWNTDNPHIHILMRGKASDGSDLVIDRDYIREGMRARAEERVTLELGVRSEQEIRHALEREVEADRWTSLDRQLQRQADQDAGVLDLRPSGADGGFNTKRLLLGRSAKLERLGLAERIGPARWLLRADLEAPLRALGMRTDIIKTMHRALGGATTFPDPSTFALHEQAPGEPVIGRLVERGLHDELAGQAYAIVDGSDGRVHHLRFDDIDMTGDARPGAIVEHRVWTDRSGAARASLAVRSDLALGEQVTARGATWLDRQLVAQAPVADARGFGRELSEALQARADHLVAEGLAHRNGERLLFAKGLIETLRMRELDDAAAQIAARTGLTHQRAAPVEAVSGTYRERVTLASGRFAMIEDGLGFQLVPWRPALDLHLGRQVSGVMSPGGGIDWTLGRTRGPGL